MLWLARSLQIVKIVAEADAVLELLRDVQWKCELSWKKEKVRKAGSGI